VAAPLPLPKAGSGAFKQLLSQVSTTLDLPRLCLVLEGALDRKSLEEILRKVLQGGHVRPGGMARGKLVAGVADAWGASPRAAFLAMRALDKGCRKERHIVGSMEEDTLDVRLSSYRALDFRRERARLIWALVRDGRKAHVAAADRILTDAFAQLEAPAAESKPAASKRPASQSAESEPTESEPTESEPTEDGPKTSARKCSCTSRPSPRRARCCSRRSRSAKAQNVSTRRS